MPLPLTIHTNALQATDVLIADFTVIVPKDGGSASFDDVREIIFAQKSFDLATFLTDDVYGAGSSTLYLHDGTDAVGQAGALTYLAGILVGGGGSGGDGSFTVTAETDDAVVIGTPVYVKTNTHVGAAQADSGATVRVAGIATAAKAPSFPVTFVTQGLVDNPDWTAVTGTALLTPGAVYYLSPTAAGALTTVAPNVAGQYIVRIGLAMTTTQLDVDIADSPIFL